MTVNSLTLLALRGEVYVPSLEPPRVEKVQFL